MNIFKRTIAVMMSAVILAGSGVIAANAATESDIVETSTTIKSADNANTSKFTFDKKTGELTLLEYGHSDFRYDNDDGGIDPGELVPWKSFRDKIKSVTITKKFGRVPAGCFIECENITKVTIPDNVKSIDELAFYNCSSLKSVDLPSGLESISFFAFYNCKSLKSIEIPEKVKTVDYNSFENCESLQSVKLPSQLGKIEDEAFIGCKSLAQINIPETVTEIEQDAFNGCESLKSVKLPDCIASISYRLFYGCKSLEDVKFSDNVKEISGYAFDDTALYNNESNWEDGALYIGNCLYKARDGKKNFTVKDGTTLIACEAFHDNKELVSVSLPDTLKYINSDAFLGCEKLKSVTIPKSVTEIGYAVFYGCADGFTINGYKNTAAHKYAKEQRLRFCNIETKQVINYGKKNPIKVTAKKKTLKAKTLKAKKVKVKLLTVKKAKGKVSYTILGVSKKLKGKVSVSKKGVFTFKKGKYKKGNFKIKVYVEAEGNTEYLEKRVKKTVKVKIK
jgi:hypothetical protein